MVFTITRPDGTTERRQHIAYTVKQTGFVWCAYRKDGSLLARDYLSEFHIRRACDSMTEPFDGAWGTRDATPGRV